MPNQYGLMIYLAAIVTFPDGSTYLWDPVDHVKRQGEYAKYDAEGYLKGSDKKDKNYDYSFNVPDGTKMFGEYNTEPYLNGYYDDENNAYYVNGIGHRNYVDIPKFVRMSGANNMTVSGTATDEDGTVKIVVDFFVPCVHVLKNGSYIME